MSAVYLKKKGTKRTKIGLDGLWECEILPFNDGFEKLPKVFTHTIPVPGLWDMAEPALEFTGDTETIKGNRGAYVKKALWYKKKVIATDIPKSVTLKIHKGFYGKEIYVNGKFVVRHEPNFTPCYADITDYLQIGENEILIKVGEKGTQNPALGHPAGFDCEKKKFVPGLYDSVELLLCDNPRIDYIQIAPDVSDGKITVQADMVNLADETVFTDLRICVKDGEKTVGEASVENVGMHAKESRKILVQIKMPDFTPWTPENPYLYTVTASTDGDEITARFGMREFRFVNKVPRLNGKTYYLRGTNVVMFRFFEDEKRADLPWDREWVKKVLLRFKSININALRFHVGFAPDFWYDLCDELGILVDDEYALFGAYECPVPAYSLNLLNEFKDWIKERANHPSVFMWDAQNEVANEPYNSFTVNTLPLIKGAKYTDLSARVWDNGWDYPESDDCSIEVHPYLFIDSNFRLPNLNNVSKDPAMTYLCPDWHNLESRKEENPFPNNARIVNEYSWLWISREGKPCRLTQDLYAKIFPDGFTERELRDYYAGAVAALTEFWRSGRCVAGIFEFCGLSYSCEGGETSDNFLPDITQPRYDAEFERKMYCAFAPVGIIIENWADTMPTGRTVVFPVTLVNDGDEEKRIEVTVELCVNGECKFVAKQNYTVSDGGKTTRDFSVPLDKTNANDVFQLSAFYYDRYGKKISSERTFRDGMELSRGLLNKRIVSRGLVPEVSSTYRGGEGQNIKPENLLNGDKTGMWSSTFADNQYVIIDFGKRYRFTDIELVWENGAKEYGVFVSDDKKNWHKVYSVKRREYGRVQYAFNACGRYVKLDLIKRLNESYGFCFWDLAFYGEEA